MASQPCDFYFRNIGSLMNIQHENLINTFYTCFEKADSEGMIRCYHDDIRFEDPAFGVLHGTDAKKMWRMLVRPGIQITFSDVRSNTATGSVNWIAEYEFGQSKRHVINRIHAEFEFKDGKIIKHTDHFNFWKWSRQALGISGLLLGWTPWMQKKVRTKVLARLKAFV